MQSKVKTKGFQAALAETKEICSTTQRLINVSCTFHHLVPHGHAVRPCSTVPFCPLKNRGWKAGLLKTFNKCCPVYSTVCWHETLYTISYILYKCMHAPIHICVYVCLYIPFYGSILDRIIFSRGLLLVILILFFKVKTQHFIREPRANGTSYK